MSGKRFTIREVAAPLKVGEKTTDTMVQPGELPGFRVRGQWRLRRSEIDAWIQERVSKQAGAGAATHSGSDASGGGR